MFKKLISIIAAAFMIFSIVTYANTNNLTAETISKNSDILLPICVKHKYGFINQDGKVVVEPRFDMAYQSINGFAAGIDIINELLGGSSLITDFDEDGNRFERSVEYDPSISFTKYIINCTGNIINSWHEDLNSRSEINWSGFKDGLLPVPYNYSGGYINEQGKQVIKFLMKERDFNEGLAAAGYWEFWGFVDKEGRFVIRPSYNEVSDYKNGFAGVRINNKYGLIDKNGRIVIPINCEASINFSEGFFEYKIGNKVFYADKSGKTVFSFIADSGTDFKDGRAILNLKNKYAVINNKGKVIVNYGKYNKLSQLESGIIIYQSSGKYGAIGENGEVISGPFYDNIKYVETAELPELLRIQNEGQKQQPPWAYPQIQQENDAFVVCKNKKYGLMDIKGKLILQPIYDDVKLVKNKIFSVEQKGKWGIIDTNGKVIIKPQYDHIYCDLTFESKGKKGLLDANGNIVFSAVYDQLISLDNGYVYYVKGNETGYFNSENKCIWSNNEANSRGD